MFLGQEAADPGGNLPKFGPEAFDFLRILVYHQFQGVSEGAVFLNQVVVFEGSLCGQNQVIVIQRFNYKSTNPGIVDGGDGHLEVAVSGEQDVGGVRIKRSGLFEELDSVHFGHLVVGQDKVRGEHLKEIECLLAVGDLASPVNKSSRTVRMSSSSSTMRRLCAIRFPRVTCNDDCGAERS